jgi:hypothetical protein
MNYISHMSQQPPDKTKSVKYFRVVEGWSGSLTLRAQVSSILRHTRVVAGKGSSRLAIFSGFLLLSFSHVSCDW